MLDQILLEKRSGKFFGSLALNLILPPGVHVPAGDEGPNPPEKNRIPLFSTRRLFILFDRMTWQTLEIGSLDMVRTSAAEALHDYADLGLEISALTVAAVDYSDNVTMQVIQTPRQLKALLKDKAVATAREFLDKARSRKRS